jgi:hypothetical protein
MAEAGLGTLMSGCARLNSRWVLAVMCLQSAKQGLKSFEWKIACDMLTRKQNSPKGPPRSVEAAQLTQPPISILKRAMGLGPGNRDRL